ncbi:MAG TPA: hypothetical protein VGD99_10945 [Anaerolineae bacterium]|jgi:hypothetical protein
MAWWTDQFVFQGDTLVAEGLDPVWLSEAQAVVQDEGPPNGSEPYSRVIVSGYALYGKLRGFYALGVAHWQFDRSSGRLFMSETSQRNSEPVSSLSPAQRAIIRECLIDLNPEAWETSNASFRNQLET